MLASQIPTKFQIPFANSAAAGTIRPVPVADQTAISPGAASLTTGFPPATGQPLASGGVPPAMQDFNGILFQDTAWARWQGAGGTVPFDQAFCTAIGGYPQGAMLQAASPGNLWLSVVDNNTSNPDGGSSSGWIPLITAAAVAGKGLFARQVAGTYAWTVPAGVYWVYVTCVGAGGGGSGGPVSSSATTNGGGGGAGGAAQGWLAVTPGQAITFVVGAGGGGGGWQLTGYTGGSSSVGSTFTATGGAGGAGGSSPAGGGGGTGSGGQNNFAGGNGTDGNVINAQLPSGVGGQSLLGGGGRSASFYLAGVSNGRAPGSGGGGTYTNTQNTPGSSGGQGGNGADGYVSFQY